MITHEYNKFVGLWERGPLDWTMICSRLDSWYLLLYLQGCEREQVVIPAWERDAAFDPVSAEVEARREPQWTTIAGSRPGPFRLFPSAEEALTSDVVVDYRCLPLRDPNFFVSGQLGRNLEEWGVLLEGSSQREEILGWLDQGVDVFSFFKRFKGKFRGEDYDSDIPERFYGKNSESCAKNADFVARELENRIRNGSLELLGRYDECRWPRCVMPLTLEPSKPRLCHDERFLNLWVKDSPFRLDTLKEVPRMMERGEFLCTTDEKSGYDHVKLSTPSRDFFGLMFDGWVMRYTTLPFGFKASCYVYHTIGQQLTGHLRGKGMPVLGYIDDRLYGPGRAVSTPKVSAKEKSDRGVYAILQLGTRLGYTYSIPKCLFESGTRAKSLGFFVDTAEQAFILPDDKKGQLLELVGHILDETQIDLRTLQRLAGKCASVALAVPGALFYTREMHIAISKASKNSRPIVISGPLRQEIGYWKFLEGWEGKALWRLEAHTVMQVATDASLYGWAGVVLEGTGKGEEVRDYWEGRDERPIHLKELQAIISMLESMRPAISKKRVDLMVRGRGLGRRIELLTDSQAVIGAWTRQGSRNHEFNDLLKVLFQLTVDLDIELKLGYIPTDENPADEGSRVLSAQDASLSRDAWNKVQGMFGPHTVDLMALDSNTMKDPQGKPLRHFTPVRSPGSSGVNMFAQDVSLEVNPYVFPPICLITAVISYLEEKAVRGCTVLVPRNQVVDMWWPKLARCSRDCRLLAHRGEKGVLILPSKDGWVVDSRGLAWDLYAVRVGF